MTEADISPLAKRLAEENNVDWRRLTGSGADGKVVERDVLEYLARVMSGQEDIDPTPEPLPEGMESWPDEDIAAYRRNARERSDGAGAAPQAAAPIEEEEIDEDIFLFEEEADADEDPFGEPTDVFAVSGHEEPAEEDDLFLDFSSEDPGPAAEEPAAPAQVRGLDAMAFDMDATGPDAAAGERRDVRDLDFVTPDEESVGVDDVAGPSTVQATAAEPGAVMTRGEPEAPVSGGEIPLVSYGRLLRRHLDLTAVKNAQAALGRDLAREELGIGAFLARAAGKALRSHPLGRGSVVLATVDDGLAYVDLGDPASASFTDVVSRLDVASPAGSVPANAALVVVDLSVLDVDEAVLDAGVPVLSLGRVLYDDEAGDVRGTLALSGDVPFQAGGRMLAAVAELLAEPVRILV